MKEEKLIRNLAIVARTVGTLAIIVCGGSLLYYVFIGARWHVEERAKFIGNRGVVIDSLLDRYDLNKNGCLEKGELEKYLDDQYSISKKFR